MLVYRRVFSPQAKREEELEALKTAMCTLDKEGVEPMCKK